MKTLVSAIIMATMAPALAVTANAQKDIVGVWSTKEGCEIAGKQNKDPSYWPADIDQMMYLTKDGIEGYEWGCQFLDKKSNQYGQTVITASCSAEGESWPELLLLEYYAPDGWRVINRVGKDINVNIFPQECKP
jgi:hypothetical protein